MAPPIQEKASTRRREAGSERPLEREMPGRRALLRHGALLIGGLLAGARPGKARGAVSRARAREPLPPPGEPALRIGLLADLHHADRPARGTRHYRLAIPRVRRALDSFRARRVDVLVELGDAIDTAAESPEEAAATGERIGARSIAAELRHLERISAELDRFDGPRHLVLGNHCVWTLTKREFLERAGAPHSHYSFDAGRFHFIVLDACFRADGTPYGRRNFEWTDCEIPPAEREWLAADLERAGRPTIVFVHQRLDLDPPAPHGIHSAPAVRRILERSGRVLAVFQGHHHRNDLRVIGGVPYCTLPAIVEGGLAEDGGHAVLEVYADGALRLEGFARAESYAPKRWRAKPGAAPAPETGRPR